MKKCILFLMCAFIVSNIYALEITKISEFAFSEMREQDKNMAIQDNKLFAVGVRGLEIFAIENDSLSLLTEYNLEGENTHISLKGSYAYISTYAVTSRLYRIDVSDIYNPIITDTLHYLGSYSNFIDGDHVFVNELLDSWLWKTHVYDNNTFQEIVTFDHSMNPVVDGLGFVIGDSYTIYLYHISNPDSLVLYGSGYAGELSSPCKATVVQDTVFIISNALSSLKFYDISDPCNWDLITELNHTIYDFSIQNNIIILRGFDDVWLYDISDVHNPVLLDHSTDNTEFYNGFTGITAGNNRVFITKYFNDKINCYNIENNVLDKYYTYSSSSMLRSLYMYNDNIYISSWQNGIQRWDITNLNNPFFVQDYYDEYFMPFYLSGEGNIIAMNMIDKTTLESYLTPLSIEPNGDLTVLDMVEYPHIQALYYRENIGFFTAYNSTLFKYELNNSNKLIEMCTLDIPISYGEIYFLNNHPDIAYVLGYSSFIVIDNVSTNDSIEIVGEHTAYYYEQNEAAEYFNYLFMSPFYHGEKCIVYDISDPLHPFASFMINKSGSIAVDEENDLLFIGDQTCTVYDLSKIDEGHVDSLYTFRNWSYAEQIVPFKREGTNYLLYLEKTSASIYEYSGYGVDRPDLDQDHCNIIGFPNPFSTSTTISFNVTTNLHELSQIKIFNVKGQLVRILTSFPNPRFGMYNAVWDGKDEQGFDVKSGIYFCIVNTQSEQVVKKITIIR